MWRSSKKPVYEKSARGRAAASPVQYKTSGLLKLFGAYIACVCACASLGIRYVTPTASQWKRGVPKPRIRERIDELHPEKGGKWESFDEIEAVALCHWYRRKVKSGDADNLEVY
jgi:hypothetical protein